MTLLDAVTKVADQCTYAIDTKVIGTNDATTKQLLAIAQRINREMADAYPWGKFYASGSITLADGVASYALPSAFSYYQYETFWNQSTRWRVLGPMSAQEYAQIIGYGLITTVYQRFQLRGITNTELLISPTPTSSQAGQIIIFEYIAARSVRPQQWTASIVFAALAYCFNNGNIYQTTGGGSGGSAPIHTSGTTGIWTYYNGIYDQFLADTDESVISQRVLEQGMLERFSEMHGLEGVVPRFIDQLQEEFGKDIPGKVLYAGGDTSKLMFARSGRAVFGTWI